MGSVNGQKYPDISAREAVDIVDVLVTTFDGAPPDRDAFAREVGHQSAASGAFKTKIADVRRYGLLPSRGLEPTELARTVVDPRDDETARAALFRAYRNVPLLSRLYDRLDGGPIREDFSDIVSELTGAGPDDAAVAASDLESLYARMRRYAPNERAGGRDGDVEDGTDGPEGGVVVRVGDDRLVLSEVSDANLELARQFVASKRAERAGDDEADGADDDATDPTA